MTARAAKELFIVQFAVRVTFKSLAKHSKFLFAGPIGWVLSELAQRLLGHMVAKGILLIDIYRMSKNVDIEEKDYRDAIYKAYVASKEKVLTDEEKKALRRAVIDATRKFVRVRAQPKNP